MTSDFSYLELYYELNRCLWNRLILQKSRACDPIERQLHILAKHLNIDKESHEKNKRRVVNYALVDYHPDVVAMRDFLSDKSNYCIDENIDTDKMTTDFLLMMALRDRHARKAGFESYATMVLELEGIEVEPLKICLNKRLRQQIESAKKLIDKHGLTLGSWYTGLRNIKCDSSVNYIMLMDQFMSCFPSASSNLIIERNTSNKAGFAVEISPSEVHINIERVDTLFDMSVFFHQMGHGLAHALDTSKGISRIYSNFYEELTGVLIERYLGKMLNDEACKCLKEIRTLQYSRFGIEALYELDLWFTDTSPEDLFRAHYQKIIGSLDDAPISVIHALRLSEPFYMYNYILADITAENIIENGPDDLHELADYLMDEVFVHGEEKSWVEYAIHTAKEYE